MRIILFLTISLRVHYLAALVSAVLLALPVVPGQAQSGAYFLSHYSPKATGADHRNFGMIRDKEGALCIANKHGLLRFDGLHWELISTPATVFSLVLGEDSTVYLGGKMGLGKLGQTDYGRLQYEPLLPQDAGTSPKNFFDLLSLDGKVYALYANGLLVYDTEKQEKVRYIEDESAGAFYRLFSMNNALFVSTENKGVLKVAPKHLSSSGLGFSTADVLFCEKDPLSERHLIATAEGLYLYSHGVEKTLALEDDGYVLDSEVTAAVWLGPDRVAIGTLKGGVALVHIDSGEIEQIINYSTGLPDNEVYAMAKDRDNGLWIAHEQGFTRVSLRLPIHSFTHFPGLEGNISSIVPFRGHLYVSTGQGIYFLDEIRNYTEAIQYIKKSKRIDLSVEHATSSGFAIFRGKKQGGNSEKHKPRKGSDSERPEGKGPLRFLKNTFGKKDRSGQKTQRKAVNRSKTPSFSDKETKQAISRQRDSIYYERHLRRELQSISYAYKKVKGISAKTFQLVRTQGRLLSAGLSGIHEVDSGGARQIYMGAVRYLFAAERSKLLIAGTDEGSVITFAFRQGRWSLSDTLEIPSGPVHHIIDDGRYFWLSSADGVHRLLLEESDASLKSIKTYTYANPYLDRTYGVHHQGQVYFLNTNAVYRYNEHKDELSKVEIPSDLDFVPPEKHLHSSEGKLWYYGQGSWHCLGGKYAKNTEFKILNLFRNIEHVHYTARDSTLWAVTADNALYRLVNGAGTLISSRYAPFLKSIRSKNGFIPFQGQKGFKVGQWESALTFAFVQPDFSGVMGVEYRYRLKGLEKDWSEWDRNHDVIAFSYLPTGRYTLQVRTRNAFGHEAEIEPIRFRVVPPYWKRSWFYALEMLFFGTLMFLSIRLNKKDNHNYRTLSRILALLTLVIIVEFVQTVTEAWFETTRSPVIDFIIHVSIALMVLPLERKLRQYFLKENTETLLPKIKLGNNGKQKSRNATSGNDSKTITPYEK